MGRKKKHADTPVKPDAPVSTDEGNEVAEQANGAEEAPPKPDIAPVSEEDRLAADFTDLQERHLRLRADFDNFRRRSRLDVEGARVAAKRDLLEVLLPAFRSLEKAADAAESEANVESLREGVSLVLKGLRDALRQQGITEIAPHGEAFDGALMEAMGMIPHDDVPEGHVAEVFQNGYRVGEHLLHPARVLVSSGPTKTDTDESKASDE